MSPTCAQTSKNHTPKSDTYVIGFWVDQLDRMNTSEVDVTSADQNVLFADSEEFFPANGKKVGQEIFEDTSRVIKASRLKEHKLNYSETNMIQTMNQIALKRLVK